MTPETFNRLENTSKEDFHRFVDWLFSQTLSELQAARGDLAATKAVWITYFQRGFKADLLLDELMGHLPELFRQVNYPDAEARQVLAMLKTMNFNALGIKPTAAGPKFDGSVG